MTTDIEKEALNPLGKYKLVETPKQLELPLEEPEDSKIDTMIQLENEAKQGKQKEVNNEQRKNDRRVKKDIKSLSL